MNLSPTLKDLLNKELEITKTIAEHGYWRAREKLVSKRIRYGIDCRVVPDNQLLCIDIENEIFNLILDSENVKVMEIFRSIA